MSEHVARKRFGQNFLHERGVIDKIIRAVAPQPSDVLVEIGPGQGALTFPLLEVIGKLTAIEIDRDLIPRLRERAAKEHKALEIVEADVLTVDFTALAAKLGAPQIRLVGNLPYNISTPILFHVMEHAAAIRDMHFMLQKEVVDRMAADEGSKVYGRLSVMLQAVCTVEPLFKVPPGAFVPAPKVDSAIVRLTPLPAGSMGLRDPAMLDRVVRLAFAQRRKTLRNALSAVADAAAIEAGGVDPTARAEDVAVVDYVRLANHLAAREN